MTFSSGFNIIVQSVATLKHAWSNKVMTNLISLPKIPPIPVATVNWHRTWDSSGNGEFSRSDMVSSDVYIEQVP